MRHAVLTWVLICFAAACSDQTDTAAQGGFQRPPSLVLTTPTQQREIRRELEAIGTAQANESVILTAKVTDTVSKVLFEDGDLVKAGDVLVELTDAEEAALLKEAEANVADARLQFQRLDNLYRQGSVPQSQADEARARYDAAQARQQSLMARLNDRLVRAPFNGLLGFHQVSEGSLATPTTPITTLDDISIIKLDFSIPEVHLGLIKVGQTLSARSPTYPDATFSATVNTIGSRVDPITRAATIRAHIDNSALLLRPGMLLTVRLTAERREALMVPETALLQRASDVFVYTVSDAHARLTQIEAGVTKDGWVEVLTGLDEGEAVVTEGVIKLRDNAPVRLQGAPAEATAGAAGREGTAS